MESRARKMKLILVLSIGCCLFLVSQVHGRSDGAPAHTCQSMMPMHHKDAQTSTPPYQILPSKGQGRIRLILGSNAGEGYTGFIVMARDVETGEIIGEFPFLPEDKAKRLECTPGLKNAVTHVSPQEVHNLEIEWEAPQDYEGTIKFNSTICKTWDVFWVGIESDPISVKKRSVTTQSGLPVSIHRPVTLPHYEPTTERIESNVKDEFYNGCGVSKNCFGIKDTCIDNKDCDAAVSVLVQGDRYIFELQAQNPTAKYVSVGLSENDKMGDDSVVDCIKESNSARLQMSWNTARGNFKIPMQTNAVKLLSSSIQDGIMKCRFSREAVTSVQGQTFDLTAKPYHLLVASGTELKGESVSYHIIGKAATGEPRKLSDVGSFVAASDLLIRIHGALMLASWIGTASIGMLLARYYRQTWVNSQLCGKDQWFAWHRFFMLLTWSMTIAGFVVIFIELEAWSTATYHASLGLATTILCFIQPFMAAMRPHPGAPKRALFNWSHWFIGNAAHICAIIAIFFAVKLQKAKLPNWVDWIIVAYVVFHVLTHFFLTFAGCASDRQGSQRVNSFPMKDVHARNSMTHPDSRRDAPYTGLRRLTFGVYFIVILLLSVALIVITVLAPIEEFWKTFIEQLSNMWRTNR